MTICYPLYTTVKSIFPSQCERYGPAAGPGKRIRAAGLAPLSSKADAMDFG
jgi:hypothetical protein